MTIPTNEPSEDLDLFHQSDRPVALPPGAARAPWRARRASASALRASLQQGQEAAEQSWHSADAEWRSVAEVIVRSMDDGQTFIAEDVVIEVTNRGLTTTSRRAIGALIQRLAREGVIHRADEMRKGTLSHGNPKTVWVRGLGAKPVATPTETEAPFWTETDWDAYVPVLDRPRTPDSPVGYRCQWNPAYEHEVPRGWRLLTMADGTQIVLREEMLAQSA